MQEKAIQSTNYSNFKIMKTLLPYLWGNTIDIKVRIIIGFLLIIITMVLNLLVPFALKTAIQALHDSKLDSIALNYQWINFSLIAYGLAYTLGQITLKSRQLIFYKVIERAMRNFSLKIFDHLHNLDLKFHLEKKLGSITNSVEKFQLAVPEIFWSLILFVIPTLIEIGIAISIVFYLYRIDYGIILLGTLLGFSLFSFIGIKLTTASQTQYDDNMVEVHNSMVDSLLNYETVRYFNNRKYESNMFDRILEKLEKSALKVRIKHDSVQMIQGIIVGIGLTTLTWCSGHDVIVGTLTIGDFIIINCYLLQFIAPLVNFGWVMVQMSQAFIKLKYVMELLEEKSEVFNCENPFILDSSPPEIIFENVSFHYHQDRPVLRNITFKIPPRNTIAIVGASGSGKSTIAKLLFRFYDVTKGRILIKNEDIRNISLDSLHSAIGVVGQDTVLFNNSIYHNILYGKPSATLKEIEEVVQLVHLADFIHSLPDKYNTIVGERGLKLSGGEKQRIAIARALLKKPSILLFDEATSSLDTVIEQEIKDNIRDVSTKCTTIIIAHRLSTITYADNIIVLEKDIIVEQGKHMELLNLKGAYANLWYKQINHPQSLVYS